MNHTGARASAGPRQARAGRRAAIAAAGAWAIIVGAGLACHPTSSVSFTLDVPSAITSNVAYYEIGAFASGSCSALVTQLPGGLPSSGEAARAVFAPTTSPEPALGNLPRGSYAFAATAKDADCNVLAIGCSEADVGSESSVTVGLTALDSPAVTCSDSTSCVDGECVPPGEGSNDIGAGCSLVLVGAGPLAEALQSTGGEVTSAPAVVVTPSGFLLAYREYDKSMNAARLTLLPVANDASAGAAAQTSLPNRCDTVESDATGLAWNGDHGLAVVSHQLCKDVGLTGEDTVKVDATGATLSGGFSTIQTPAMQTLLLSTGHAVTAEPDGDDFFVAQGITNRAPDTTPPYATISLTDGLNATLAAQYTSPSTVSSSVVASTATLVATGSVGTDGTAGASNVVVPLADAGATDGGADSGAVDAGGSGGTGGTGGPVTGEDGGANQMAYLRVGPPATDLGSLPLVGTWTADWLSLAADASRTYALSGTAGVAELRSVDLGGMASSPLPVQLTGEGDVIFADAALSGDHLFLAVERSGALALVTYDRATTTPKLLRQIDLDKDPRVGTFTDLADGRVAIAASGTRVAIVWTTQKTLLERDPVGGYAVYACAP
jgi:hypothetical protein